MKINRKLKRKIKKDLKESSIQHKKPRTIYAANIGDLLYNSSFGHGILISKDDDRGCVFFSGGGKKWVYLKSNKIVQKI